MTDHFADSASTWDSPRKIRMAETFIHALEQEITIQPCWKCMEVGAGTGLAGLLLLPKLKHVVFEDTSEKMLQVLREKTPHVHNIEIFLGETTEYNSGNFDLIISNMAFHHINDIEKTLRHLFQITQEKATIAIADILEEDGGFHRQMKVPHNGFNVSQLSNTFYRCGFEVTCSRVFDWLKKEDINGVVKTYERFIMIAKKRSKM